MATVNIVWNWGTNSSIDFNPATDILDFGWFAADQFTISEVSGTVVIAIASNHQTYTLQHTTLSELHLSNIVAKDASATGACKLQIAEYGGGMKLGGARSSVVNRRGRITSAASPPSSRGPASR